MKKAPSSLFYFLLITASLSANIDIINLENIATDGDDFTIWSALFGLGIVSLIALFLSSEQLTNFKKYIYEKQEKRDKTEQTQNQILSSMSENIQAIAQETTATAKKLATENERGNIEQDLERVLNSEHQLLALTTNLIEFLKIKSKKVELVNESLLKIDSSLVYSAENLTLLAKGKTLSGRHNEGIEFADMALNKDHKYANRYPSFYTYLPMARPNR